MQETPLNAAPGPLEGTLVLEVSQAVTGPYAAWLLASMGARVIKVEGPEGDLSRVASRRGVQSSVLYALYNRGKESVCINLKTSEGRDVFRQLAAQADVLIENFVPGTMESWGLDYPALSTLNPRLVYASVSGFGRDSRYARAPALDMVIEAMSGIMAATGLPDQPPLLPGILLIDTLVSPYLAAAVTGAIYQRKATGLGSRIEIAMRDAAACIPFNLYNIYYDSGRVPARTGNLTAGYSPGNLYPAADGWVYIACNSDKQAHGLFAHMGRQDMVDSERFASRLARWNNRAEIDEAVSAWTVTLDKLEIQDQLMTIKVPCGPVMDIEEVLNDVDLNDRGVFANVDQPEFGSLKLPRSPIGPDSSPANICPAPSLGQDTVTVLREMLGLDERHLVELAESGAISVGFGGKDAV